jgi:hypothetical protein
VFEIIFFDIIFFMREGNRLVESASVVTKVAKVARSLALFINNDNNNDDDNNQSADNPTNKLITQRWRLTQLLSSLNAIETQFDVMTKVSTTTINNNNNNNNAAAASEARRLLQTIVDDVQTQLRSTHALIVCVLCRDDQVTRLLLFCVDCF